MPANKISFIALLLLTLSVPAIAEEHKPQQIEPYQIPAFTGEPVDWHKTKPAIDAKKRIDGDAIFNVVNKTSGGI